jgi:hypothetical protein
MHLCWYRSPSSFSFLNRRSLRPDLAARFPLIDQSEADAALAEPDLHRTSG